MKGRPFRFLGMVLGGWAALRTVALWPVEPLIGDGGRGLRPSALVSRWTPVAEELLLTSPRSRLRPVTLGQPLIGRGMSPGELPRHVVAVPRQRERAGADPDRLALAMLGLVRVGPAQHVVEASPRDVTTAPELLGVHAEAPGAARWSGSGWLVARAGSGLSDSPFAGQLGGSQAGLRLAYAIDLERGVNVVGRAATPLSGAGREAAIGVEWQPGRAPVRIIAEQRIGIDPGTGGPALGLIGGLGLNAIGDFRLEAYGQVGVIARGGAVGYADGSVRVDRVIARHRGATVSAGGALWGAAQPGTERLDAGPVLALSVPVAKQRVRLSLEWRARIGGRAAPGSGPALSLGGDF
ncbi:MAG: hypothetical protein C0474_11520 [Sphingobium sp.]|nr:hypothetical protein [Sphingobium sp.]